jgi:TatD DNase family protein
MEEIIDIGANLTNKRFDADRDSVLENAKKKGVKHILITGTSLQNTKEAIELARKNPQMLSATCGIHPHNAKDLNSFVIDKLRTLAMEPEVVAIGECGLDFNRNFSPRIQQEYAFEVQMQLAKELNKPLFLHERDAYLIFIKMLKNHTGINGVVHCFTGNKEIVKAYLDQGMYIGITGWITDNKRNKELLEAIKYIPLDKLMVETDAPFLTPKFVLAGALISDNRNEPAFLPAVVSKIADVLNKPYEEIARITTKNATKLFNLKA